MFIMGDLVWTNDLVVRLMQEYEKRPELWNPSHEMYRVQSLKYETWKELAAIFECEIGDLRKKLNSLFASHRREKGKIRAGGRSTWFLYPYMSFLPTHMDSESSDVTIVSERKPLRLERVQLREPSPPVSETEEYLEEALEEDEVLVKVEPEQRTVKPRPYIRNALHHKPKLTRPIKRRIVTKETYMPSSSDNRITEALRLLRRTDVMTRKKDECDSFGEYIADSLRKHDERTQSMIKQAINNILFEQEMKKYNTNQYTILMPGVDENPLDDK